MAFKNWDYFISNEDKKDIKCLVCGKKLTGVSTNGQTAPYSEKIDHWVFQCPDSSFAWHEHVLALKQEAYKTVSKRIKEIILEEAEEELQNARCL